MNIHEYQAKEILAGFGIVVPKGGVAKTPEEAKAVAQTLDTDVYVVKAQIHAGGRGKGTFKEAPEAKGGVRIVSSADAVKEQAKEMLGKTLVTIQTGPEGKQVQRLYVEEGSDIEKEYYLSVLVDRQESVVTFIASQEGGMDIEEVAEASPEKIVTLHVDPVMGIQGFHARKIGFALGFRGAQLKGCMKIVFGLYKALTTLDANQIEINPLVQTKSGDIVVLDAKVDFDDNALFRHKDIEALRDEDEEEPLEREAARHDLSYIKMEGSIGCMVNGAGLAMATMDIIKLHGEAPANFLDVGGGATKERVIEAFKIILSDSNVKGILVNIFGGIMRCDIIAEGVIAAAKEVGLSVPLVVRLEGTNVEKGKEILEHSGLPITSAANLEEAACKIVASVREEAA